jgi:hypothetical protein
MSRAHDTLSMTALAWDLLKIALLTYGIRTMIVSSETESFWAKVGLGVVSGLLLMLYHQIDWRRL